MTAINETFKLLNSKRQPPNLKKLLTKAKFSNTVERPGSSPCNAPRCKTCPLIQTTTSFTFRYRPESPFALNRNLNCMSKNVIYAITCVNCHKEYIGQTSNLRDRVTLHRQQIRDPRYRHLPVSKHIYSCNYNPDIPFRICPLSIKENETARSVKIVRPSA